jgi:AcrR family transcriptional regulator
MAARADAAAATGEKILDATEAVFDERPFDEVTLVAVAERAGVTVQTIIRRFGSKEGLFTATLAHTAVKMSGDRDAPAGEPKAAIDILVDHYEEFGSRVLRLLAAEERNETLHALADIGRAYHQKWCEDVFASSLSGLRGAKRKRRVAQLIAVTDIYVWKLLRRDRELSAGQVKLAMRELLKPLVEACG